MSASAPVIRKPGFPFRRFASDSAYVIPFNVLCAAVVTYVIGVGDNFMQNLLISMCIGTLAFVLIDGMRLALWGEDGRPHWLVFILILAVSVPAAQFLGSNLAGSLLGVELRGIHTLGQGRTTSMLLFSLLAVAAGTLFFTSRDRLMRARAEAAQERARAEEVARQALQAQLRMLQAQIEPHMLFNTLANLQGLIAIDAPRAQLMLDQLIQYLRATLSSSRAEATTLAQEFALMDAYLGLMRFRMGSRLSYTLELPPALASTAVPPMLLQPLVENAIAHGLEPKIEGGHVTVAALMEEGLLTVTVRDDGRGPDAAPGKQGTHLGLANTRERLRALYGERASLSLEAAVPCGATARITLPI